MTDRAATSLLLVGAVTVDTIDGEQMPGGAVAYGAQVAAAFGIRAQILTIAGPDADLSPLDSHDVHVIDDAYSVTFAFEPSDGERLMRVPTQPSRPLSADDLPDDWSHPGAMLIAPLVRGDIDIDSFSVVAEAADQVGMITQGLQRQLDDEHVVEVTVLPGLSFVRTCSHLYSCFRSTREAGFWTREQTETMLSQGARLVTTRGEDGAVLERDGVRLEVPAFPIEHEADTTGAGDVFATALILALDQGEQAAARIAAAFAAASVEQIGPAPLPMLSEIMRRLSAAESSAEATERGASG